jgi:hypothetical protein
LVKLAFMKNIKFIILSTFLICFSFFLFSYFRYFDPDLWGHLKFGEYIVLNKTLLFKDIYAFIPTKSLWVNHEWLSEVLFYSLFSINKAGIILLLSKAIVLSSAILLPWFYVSKKSKNHYLNCFLFAVLILVMSYGSAIRPQIFSYLFFSLTVFIIDKFSLNNKITYFSLPLIFILWVNFHGGVLAGLVLVYFIAIYEIFCYLISHFKNKQDVFQYNKFKVLIIPVVLTLLLIVNPYTYHYFGYIIDAITMKRPCIEEWRSVFSTVANFTYLKLLVIIIIITFLTTIKYINKDRFLKILLISLLLFISLLHSRHLPFLTILCAYYLPQLISDALANFKVVEKIYNSSSKLVIDGIITFFLCFLSVVCLYNTFYIDGKPDYYLRISLITTPQYIGYPVNSIIFIKKNHIKGNMITDFNWGEFIIYQLYPSVKVSIDGRYETVYDNSIFEDNLAFLDAKKGWQTILRKFNPDLILVSKGDNIASILFRSKNWKLLFSDFEALLFVKIDQKNSNNRGST